MKLGKRLIGALMALLMLAVMMTACGDTSDPDASKPASSSSAGNTGISFKMPEKALDFEGRTITIASIWAGGNAWGEGEAGKSAADDLWLEWKRTVESTYNCTVKVVPLNSNDTQVSMINKFMAGEKVADLFVCQMVDLERTRLAGDFLVDLNTVSTLDLQCEGNLKYGRNIMEACTWNGKTYAVNPIGGNIQQALIVNMQLLESLNLGYDLWDMVDNKTWNLDALRTVLEKSKKDLNGDGKYTSKDQWGTYYSQLMVSNLVMNAGVRALTKKDDGKVEYTLNNAKTIDVVNQIKNVLADSGLCPETRTDALYAKLFKQGQIVLMPAIPWSVDTDEYRDLDFDLGMLPVPLMGDGTEYLSVGDAWMQTYCIPKLNTEPEYAGLILQSFIEDLGNKLNDLSFDHYANSVFPTHERSMEVFKMLQSNITYDLAYPETGFSHAFYSVQNAITSNENTIATLLEAVDSELQAFVKDTYNKAVR